MKTKVYKIELMVVDYDGLGEEEVVRVLENTKYPNWCIYPNVMGVSEREVDWSDEHPLNFGNNQAEEFRRLFSEQ